MDKERTLHIEVASADGLSYDDCDVLYVEMGPTMEALDEGEYLIICANLLQVINGLRNESYDETMDSVMECVVRRVKE